MPTFVMLTHPPRTVRSSPAALAWERANTRLIGNRFPEVGLVASYEVLGSRDFLDIFQAPDRDTADAVCDLVERRGHAQGELWPVADYPRLHDLAHAISLAH